MLTVNERSLGVILSDHVDPLLGESTVCTCTLCSSGKGQWLPGLTDFSSLSLALSFPLCDVASASGTSLFGECLLGVQGRASGSPGSRLSFLSHLE